MGTTLTGTTPQDTYDSLIKVTDNGPLSGTAKYLSDGLGNDSVLALSTTAVGVGTTTMSRKFNIDGGSITSDTPTLRISSTDGSGTRKFGIEFYSNSGADVRGKLLADNSGKVYLDDNGGGGVVLQANGGTGNVGIGTSAPTTKLTVNGVIRLFDGSLTGTGGVELSSEAGFGFAAQAGKYKLRNANNTATYISVDSDGLKFGSDTAAANALDDYEEGTWTMGVSFGGAAVGVTYTSSTGSYTKVGRQVTVNGLMSLTSKGSSAGDARITGLPFAIANTASNYSAPSLWIENITFANQYQAFGDINSTNILLSEVTILGVATNLSNADFANNSQIVVSFTYSV